MQHGRDHDERLQKSEKARSNNLPREDETELEAELLTSGRHHTGPQESGARSQGTEVAPTQRAAERERERHRLEREAGHIAAGIDGRARPQQGEEATRERLDDAAREADRHVAGHELTRPK